LISGITAQPRFIESSILQHANPSGNATVTEERSKLPNILAA
jgi:hypothetical protein